MPSKLDKRIFFVMPFGRNDIDEVWKKVYKPVSKSLGFEAVRVDEKNRGKIKIDQIYNELSTADIIVGDLTHKRPNCYFEIGYARAKRMDEVIILCVKKGHRVHFDLAPYDVIRWDIDNLSVFKAQFRKCLNDRIKYIEERLNIPETVEKEAEATVTSPSVSLENVSKNIRKELEGL